MYGLVLMTAMTTTPNAPEFNGYFRDLLFGNCSGCAGYTAPRYNCGGAYYPAGCSGSLYAGCNGCNGDTFLNRVRRWFDRGDCCGGVGSGYGFGCSGSRYGCSGTAAYSCFGSTAAAYSCFGSPAVSYTPVVNGGQSCYGGPTPSAPAPIFNPYPTTPLIPGTGPEPTIPYAPPEPAPGTNLNTGLKPSSALVSNSTTDSVRATVIVRLPADARLFADGRALTQSGGERKFVSPALPTNQDFSYRFRVEYERDGETISVTKKVPVWAGGTATIEFADLTAKSSPDRGSSIGAGAVAALPTAMPAMKQIQAQIIPAASTPISPTSPIAASSDRATITVKLPPGAVLYIDDRKSSSTDLLRQFSTPPLPPGRDLAYRMKVEIVRNGQMETFTQKVPFRAGERVEVDFSGIVR
jgi:uncharacterized protein (TIGR03000 family)